MGDMWGRKRTLVTSVVIYSLGSFACALARAPLWFACFRVVAGIGMGMTLQNAVGLVSEYFPAKFRQAAVAGVSTGMQWGGILSALVAIALVERYGWASAYYFGSLPILLVPVLILYLPEAPWILVLKHRWSKLRQVLAELRPDVRPLAPRCGVRLPKVPGAAYARRGLCRGKGSEYGPLLDRLFHEYLCHLRHQHMDSQADDERGPQHSGQPDHLSGAVCGRPRGQPGSRLSGRPPGLQEELPFSVISADLLLFCFSLRP